MRVTASMFLVSLVLTHPLRAQDAAVPPARQGPSQRTFEALYQQFLDGLRLRDTARYRDLLTADYVYVGGDRGQVIRGRAARLAFDLSSRDSWDEFTVERCELVIRASVAVGPCWYRAKGVSDGRAGEWRGVSFATFVREGARWRIAGTRPSVLPPMP